MRLSKFPTIQTATTPSCQSLSSRPSQSRRSFASATSTSDELGSSSAALTKRPSNGPDDGKLPETNRLPGGCRPWAARETSTLSKSAQERMATTTAMATPSARRPPRTSTLLLAALHGKQECGRSSVILLQDDVISVSFHSSLCANYRASFGPIHSDSYFFASVCPQDMLSEGRGVYVHTSCCLREALMVPPLHRTTPLAPL